MNKENFALKLVDEIILYYDARLKEHQTTNKVRYFNYTSFTYYKGSTILVTESIIKKTLLCNPSQLKTFRQ